MVVGMVYRMSCGSSVTIVNVPKPLVALKGYWQFYVKVVEPGDCETCEDLRKKYTQFLTTMYECELENNLINTEEKINPDNLL